jgi:hypothetical protein
MYKLTKTQKEFDAIVDIVGIDRMCEHLSELELTSDFLGSHIKYIPHHFLHTVELTEDVTQENVEYYLKNAPIESNFYKILQIIINKFDAYRFDDLVYSIARQSKIDTVGFGDMYHDFTVGKYTVTKVSYLFDMLCPNVKADPVLNLQMFAHIEKKVAEIGNTGSFCDTIFIVETSEIQNILDDLERTFNLKHTVSELFVGVEHSKYSNIVYQFEKYEDSKIFIKLIYDKSVYEIKKHTASAWYFPQISATLAQTKTIYENLMTVKIL